MTDATRAKVRAVAEALSRTLDWGAPRCTARMVVLRLADPAGGLIESPWDTPPSEATVTSLARAHLPGVVGDDLVWDCLRGAALYAEMERGP